MAEKYLAVTESTVLALWFGTIATWVVVSGGDMPDTVSVLVAAIVAVLVGVAAYSALFIAISLLVPRALDRRNSLHTDLGITYQQIYPGRLDAECSTLCRIGLCTPDE